MTDQPLVAPSAPNLVLPSGAIPRAKELELKDIIPGPGWVLCEIPRISSLVEMPPPGAEEARRAWIEGMIERPVIARKIGPPAINKATGQPLPKAWFAENEQIYVNGRFFWYDGWGYFILILQVDVTAKVRAPKVKD